MDNLDLKRQHRPDRDSAGPTAPSLACRCFRCAASPRASSACRCWSTSISTPTPARSTPWWARTGPARTLMKVLAGAHQPDAGRVIVNGVEVRFATHRRRSSRASASSTRSSTCFRRDRRPEHLPWARTGARVAGRHDGGGHGHALADSGSKALDPPGSGCATSPSPSSSGRDRQGAVVRGQVLIMDEPTAALSRHGVDALFKRVASSSGAG